MTATPATALDRQRFRNAANPADRRPSVSKTPPGFAPNIAQAGDALELLQSLPDCCTPLVVFDTEFRELLDRQQYGNEGKSRQKRRAELPTMSRDDINTVSREIARVLKPGGYLMRWVDDYVLGRGHHFDIADVLKLKSICAWDCGRMGQGYRFRNQGDYLLAMQRSPFRPARWRDRKIPTRWPEQVDRSLHAHIKPIGLISRVIDAVTEPGDLVVDPAAGSFVVMHAAHQLGRDFIGCDLAFDGDRSPDSTQTDLPLSMLRAP